MKLLDQMPTHPREMLGVLKVEISYLLQYDPTSPVTLQPLHPNLILPLENSITMDELFAYTPHIGPSYEADNAQVYSLSAQALTGTNTMTSIKRHKQRRDGRSEYLDLVTHNMGYKKWENNLQQAESVLLNKVWNVCNSRYSLKGHIDRNRKAFNGIFRSSYQIKYVCPNKMSRVR